MRVLITGASGQLGTDTAAHCASSGDDVHALSHADLDVTDRDAVLQCVHALAPDVVIHGGAWTNVDGCELDPQKAYAVNAIGTRNIAEAAAAEGARVVYVSTDYVFDGRGAGPDGGGAYREWDLAEPISHYGRSKLGGEQELWRILGADATVARTSWVCGVHGANFLKTMLRLAEAGRADGTPVNVVDDQRGAPTFTADLAVALRTLAVRRLPGLFHLSNTGPVTWCAFARAIFTAAGHDADRVRPITSAELLPARPAPRPSVSELDNAAWRALGLPALREWAEPLREAVDALTGRA